MSQRKNERGSDDRPQFQFGLASLFVLMGWACLFLGLDNLNFRAVFTSLKENGRLSGSPIPWVFAMLWAFVACAFFFFRKSIEALKLWWLGLALAWLAILAMLTNFFLTFAI